MAGNALGQSDCRVLKSSISLEQNDEKTCIFACCYKLIEIKGWLKNIRVVMIIIGYATLIAGL